MRNPFTLLPYRIPAVLALMAIVSILAFATVMTVSAQSDNRDWKQSPTGLNVTAGDAAGELDITWDAHPQTSKTLSDYRVTWTPDGESFKTNDHTEWYAYPTTNQVSVTGLDAGETYKVRVRARYDDNRKSHWSDVVSGQAGVSQNSPATGQPTIAGTIETGETLTAATSSISDDNGLANAAFAYQWIHTATDSEAYIPAATASSYLLSSDDLGHSIKVRVTFTDDDGYTERLTSSATALVIMQANVAATGQPTITGSAEVGETLTAATSAISDSNGITNAVFSHQWVRSTAGSHSDITDATGSTYVITNADIDTTIKIRVSFTDDDGYSETITSSATTSVPVPAPVIVPAEEPQIAQASHDGLVSNTGQTTTTAAGLVVGSSLGNKYSQAQQFTTGDNEDGYTLSSVQIYIRDFGGSDAARVSIYEADSSGKPSGSLYPLMNPGSVSNNSLNTFTAPANATLAKETKYFVIAEATSGSYQIGYTSSNAEDSGKANGWSINNRRHTRDSDSGSWSLSPVGNTNIRISVSGTITPSDDITVPNNWSLKPSGLGVGDEFRLIFLSSTKRNASSTSISTYNTWIQGRAAAGHADIRTYSDGFTVVGCAAEDDARDNTYTTFTSTDKGVPIYWMNGTKVADEYEDFYDGSWDDEANDKNELGANGPNTSQSANYPFTGCEHDGTEDFDTALATPRSKALGTIYNVRLARPNSSISGHGPLSSALNEASRSSTRPMYGLSAVFTIVEPSDDAKLSALDIEGATGSETITLSPAFAANTGNYTATVPNNIEAVTLTATTNESNATVAITNDDDTSSKNEADLDLIVGDTTLTVTVTAQNGSTKTYTIIVTRAEDIVLVSNTGQTRANESGAVQSQPFTTGSNLGGYTLTSVDVGFQGDNVRTRLFHIVPNQGNGEPDLSDPTKFITLTTPRTTTANKIHTFMAPADANLAANTTYHLLLANSDGGVPGNIHRTSSNAEDDGGAPGWSIGNKRYWRNGNSGPWSDDTTNIVRMQINGRNALPATDATLSALVIEGATSGESISLSPAFAAGTLTYTAEVAYGIDTVTLTATTNHSGATVAIADDDDAITKNEADLDLSGGVNTLTVTVTAEDTTTTETYTITVTRGSTDATLSSLMIQDTANGETVDLNPAFVADTLAYTARVAHSINVVTLTATTNQSGAMVAITDDDDAITKNKADLDIDVGANTLTVTVTAEDTTTETYTVTVTRAQDPTVPPTVPPTWSLVPSGLSDGDQFRLLFVSAIRRNGSSSDIADYNTFVQEQAAAGHADIQTYSNRFTAVGCTEAVDARDNTGTTYTANDKGVRIYWLNGAKVVDDYEDFYDGSWDDEAASKNELGTATYDISHAGNRPLTGCSDGGTEKITGTDSSALGNDDVTVARPNSSGTSDGPLSSSQKIDKTFTRPMYALSQVFTVTAPADCPTDATWCTTMGVRNDTDTSSVAKYEFSGYNITDRNSTLGSTTFSHESTDYTVSRLEQTTLTALPANTISFRTFFLKAEPPLPADTILKLGNRSFTVGDESEHPTPGTEQWDTEDNPLNWTNRQDVTVSLTLPADGQTNHVPLNWSLKPNGLTTGDRFRLLFLSSTKRNATSSDIAVYNAWIQDRIAAGHADILAYSSGFTAVGCTEDTDARDNTSTTHTVIDRGVPIYWITGNKVAEDYPDFYDETWDDETNPKDESGNNGPDTSVSDNYPITGCDHDGTENVVSGHSLALGSAPIRVAVPDATDIGSGPLSSTSNLAAPTAKRPMYGLSAVFIVAGLSTDATLSGLNLVGTAVGDSITLVPRFDEDTFTYTARVGNTIDEVTLTATKSDSNAIVAISDDDDANTPNEATLDLNFGDKTLTITVTAADTTTETYTITVTRETPPVEVAISWGLMPAGLSPGDQFRLLFTSSTSRDATSTDIEDYNSFVQNRAANGHVDIRAHSAGFRVVGCTDAVNARDNTGTRYTSTHTGIPIYWVTGDKVADDYQDFYDSTWDNESNPKTETGSNRPGGGTGYPFTGCKNNGTADNTSYDTHALGSTESVRLGIVGSDYDDQDPLHYGGLNRLGTQTQPFYGLSEIFQVIHNPPNPTNPPVEVPVTWGLMPARLSVGDQFRLLFTSSTSRNATSTDIETYNSFVQNRAAAGHVDIRAHSAGFRVVGCTDAVNARDNTGTRHNSTYRGVPIYWVTGDKVADDYQDFYDSTWDNESNPKTETGSNRPGGGTGYPFTGCKNNGTADNTSYDTHALGSTESVRLGIVGSDYDDQNPLHYGGLNRLGTQTQPFYGLSEVFQVIGRPAAPTNLQAAADGTAEINLNWHTPTSDGGDPITGYKIQHSPNGTSDWTNLVADTGDTDTAYSHTGLNPQTTGYYRVFAINSVGISDASNVANATTNVTPIDQVTGVNIIPSNGALSVRWTVVTDATGYKIQWKTGGQSYNASQEASITSGSTTNYVISGLNNGTQYTVRVIATKTGANDGPPSAERTGTPADILPTVTFGPGSFTASENGATATVTVELSVPAADDVTIPLRVQHRNGATSADYSGVPRRLIFEDGNTIRSFTVTAVDDSDNDDDEKITIEFGDLPPGFPAGARSSITVNLKDNDGGNSLPLFDPANELRYLVENTAANQNVGLPITATDADGDSLSYTFSGPDMDRFTFVHATAQLRTKSGQTYDYETHELLVVRVTADDGNGGTKTATVVIYVRDIDEPPPAPTNLTLVQAYPTSMALSWTPPDNTGRPAITGYDLQYKKSNQTTWTAEPQGITETSDSITGLDPSTSYHVQVRANNDEGNGPWSSTFSHSTPSSSPGISITKTNLTITEGDQTGRIYFIVLGSQPTADVHIYISGYDATTVAPHSRSKTFNTLNWNAPRQVLLRTIEDADTTDEAVTITHRVESDDTDYEGIAVPDMTVTVIDNDTPQVTGVWTQPGDRQLIVNWNATDKATGYKVQWKAPGDNYNTNARMATITSGSTTTYTIPNLTNGTEYTVLVTATWTDHSDGPRSDEATGTPTATP